MIPEKWIWWLAGKVLNAGQRTEAIQDKKTDQHGELESVIVDDEISRLQREEEQRMIEEERKKVEQAMNGE